MPDSKDKSKGINGKWLAIGAGSLLFIMMLPSVFLLAKIAIGLIAIAATTISVKTFLKATSNSSEEKKTDQVVQQTTKSKIAVGLTSISVLLLSAFTIVKVGLIAAACAAVIALASYDFLKDKEIGKNTNDKFNKVADCIANFIASRVTEPKNCQV